MDADLPFSFTFGYALRAVAWMAAFST